MSNHSARTLNMMRQIGFHGDVVERWIPFGPKGSAEGSLSGVRKDYCGFADLIVFGRGRVIALQVCPASTLAEHTAKLIACEVAREWVRSGGELWIVAWRKMKGQKNRLHWEPRWFKAVHDFTTGKLVFEEKKDIYTVGGAT
jgi:hypothetical protein